MRAGDLGEPGTVGIAQAGAGVVCGIGSVHGANIGAAPMLRLIAVGRLRDGPEAELFARYNARLRPKFAVTEVPEARGAPAEVKRREGEALLAALPAAGFVVALDPGGNAPDSEELARLLERWLASGRPVCFLIGGAEGLDAPVIARANYVLSLGRLTWPHFLARAMLAEQVFRARSIASGHPYHRAGRPSQPAR
jgi:23S rRNA (pseudouridine1915-N3)-methyltransferase